MISKIREGLITLVIQLKNMIVKTFDFKGTTTLHETVYAFSFQMLMIMLTFIFFLGSRFIIIPDVLFFIFFIYVILTLISTLSMMTRRLRDAHISPYNLFYLPLSYVILGIVGSTMLRQDLVSIGMMLMLAVFFLSHFYMIILLLLPTHQHIQE